MTILRKAVLLALYGTATFASVVSGPAAFAQAVAKDKKDEPQAIEGVSVVGSRRVNASSTDTPVPVDFIPMAKVSEQGGQFDLAQTLTYISPSFNSTRQNGADGADLVDSAALRGLGSDQTLVLVNGILDDMGHGDELCLVDRNFPAFATGRPVIRLGHAPSR